MYEYETMLLQQGNAHIAGTDEAGRGPLAGPLVVAAVILDPALRIEGLNDSKKLSHKKRVALAEEIKSKAFDYALVEFDSTTVDRLNVYQASKRGMTQAVGQLKSVDHVLSDAMPFEHPCGVTALIKGDQKSATIAAASILAKVRRDEMMVDYAQMYPHYGFESHKGYGTKKHIEALRSYGACAIHRRSFAPVRQALKRQIKLNVGE